MKPKIELKQTQKQHRKKAQEGEEEEEEGQSVCARHSGRAHQIGACSSICASAFLISVARFAGLTTTPRCASRRVLYAQGPPRCLASHSATWKRL